MDVRKQDLKKTRFEPPAKQPRRTPAPQDSPPPVEPDPLPERPDPSELPFGPPDPEAAYRALEELYARQPFSTRLHSQTGLPAYLVGELQEVQGGSPIEEAEAYLKENQMALLGHAAGAWIEHTHEAEWDDGTWQVGFDQTNEERVPLYGSSVTCSYRGERLIVVNSTMYPALPEEINGLEWPKPEWLDGEGILKLSLPEYIQPVRFEAPRDLRQETHPADRWILPYGRPLDPDRPSLARVGTYRPVWQVMIVDKSEKRWLVLVDAETSEALYLEPTRVEASVQADVYETTQAALQGPQGLSNVVLDYGGGADMAHADHVQVTGANFVEPVSISNQELRQLSATVFFHIRKIQNQILALLAGLISLSRVNPGAFPDPAQDINIELSDQTGSAEYDPQTGTIVLYNGVDQIEPWPINRPGYDAEVIYHEFIHALDRFLNPQLYKFNSFKQRSCTQAIDEGLAFYFACVLGDDAHWAEFAYQRWVDNQGDPYRHLEQGPTTPAQLLDPQNGDPSNQKPFKLHAIGAWWARLVWALRAPGQLGPQECNQLLFRTVRALAPVEEPSDFVAMLEGMAQTDVHKAKIKAMAAQFEVSRLHYTNGGLPFVQ